ncbi:hypothetical protein [Bdellovibrio sp. HCB209]|uniref:hypothetical protein n=1 Tax=Bdellovibrio sp. HCB209 TaxID=3394354 RepID=UPI0039B6DB20
MKPIGNNLTTRLFNLIKDFRVPMILGFLGLTISVMASYIFGIVALYVAVAVFVVCEIWFYLSKGNKRPKTYFCISPTALAGAYFLSLLANTYAKAQAGPINTAITLFVFTTSIGISKDPNLENHYKREEIQIILTMRKYLMIIAVISIARELAKTLN